MFTGLIEEVGKVENINNSYKDMKLTIKADKVLENTNIGDSIAVNGVCLTVTNIQNKNITFDVSNETLNRSNLRFLKIGDYINLERALRLSDRLGGHIVQGHVDTIGKIVSIKNFGNHTELIIEIPEDYKYFVIEKGSIAIDGISLTINYIQNNKISINIIPHTYQNTNLKYRKVGDFVNIEFDILGKYVLKFISGIDIIKSKDERLKELLNGL